MRLGDAVLGPRGSLQRSLVGNVAAALVVCIAIAASVMVTEFYEHLDETIATGLRREAEEVAAALVPGAPGLGLAADTPRLSGDSATFRYTVFGPDWRILAGGELADLTPTARAALLDPARPGEGAIRLADGRAGIVTVRETADGPLRVLASTRPVAFSGTPLQTLLHELREQVWWVVFGAAAVLTAAAVAARRALRPLRAVMAEAGGVVPGAPQRRLGTRGLPLELHALIAAVNTAFDRLEEGYQAQRAFSSNVAHEVRTPLAVLRSGLERLPPEVGRDALLADLGQLDRLFVQLIDLARAEAAGVANREPVDLHDVAMDVATALSVPVLRAGRGLAVSGAGRAPALGNRGLLGVALSNLVRNAMAHAPEGSEIDIEVVANPPALIVHDTGPGVPEAERKVLFERFLRGRGATAGGAGIGLAIVRAVAEAHGGRAEVTARAPRGASFAIVLPPPPTAAPVTAPPSADLTRATAPTPSIPTDHAGSRGVTSARL